MGERKENNDEESKTKVHDKTIGRIIEKATVMKYVSVFHPKGKNRIVHDYPELSRFESLKALGKNSDFVFVWYYACKASPYYESPNKVAKIQACIKKAYTKGMADGKKKSFLSGDFPEPIKRAIKDVESFEPGPRIRAKIMAEETLAKLEALVMEDVNESDFLDEDNNINYTAKKAYAAMLTSINKDIPDIISKIETGYGVSFIDKKDIKQDIDDSTSLMDEFLHKN